MKDNANPDIKFNDDRCTKASNVYIYIYIYMNEKPVWVCVTKYQ